MPRAMSHWGPVRVVRQHGGHSLPHPPKRLDPAETVDVVSSVRAGIMTKSRMMSHCGQ